VSGERATRRTWLSPPRVTEWAAILVIVGAVAYLIAGPSRTGLRRAPVAQPEMRVEQSASGGPVARLDDERWRATFEAAGLADPPRLDGGDPVPVRAILEQFRRWTESGDLAALDNLGLIYLALEEHRAALEQFAALRGFEPDHPRWAYMLGTAAHSQRLDDLAIESFRSALRDDPYYATTHARLGALHLDRGELDEAERSYERCRQLAPDISLGCVGLGRVALARGDAEAAEAWLRRAIEATPNDFRAYRFLSRALAARGLPEQAREARATAERLPQYSGWLVFDERLRAAHALADTQRHLDNQLRLLQGGGDPERIVQVAGTLLERRPQDAVTLAVMTGALIELRRLDEARDAAARGLEIDPRSTTLLCLLAQTDMTAGRNADALTTIDRAIAIDPRDATAHDIRGRVLYLSERMDEAIVALRRALELQPDRHSARLALAVILAQQGDRDGAIAELRELLARDPSNAEATRRLERLIKLP
jgi:tetratricopeptide (TPR) repeat protein